MDKTLCRMEIPGLMMSRVVRDGTFAMVSRHVHATYELYFLLEGERDYFIDSETYRIQAGDAVLIRPDHIHKTTGAGRHDRLLMQLDGGFVAPVLQAAGLPDIGDLFGADFRILHLPYPSMDRVQAHFEQLRQELQQRQPGYAAAARLEAAGILTVLWRAGAHGQVPLPRTVDSARNQKVHEIAVYLTEHPETQESLEELAERFYISRSWLSRIFREVTSFSVNEYRNICRVKKAQQLLQHGDAAITDVAALTGFSSLTYFERVFRQYAETTPLRYRKHKQP